jgi:transposase-like protein
VSSCGGKLQFERRRRHQSCRVICAQKAASLAVYKSFRELVIELRSSYKDSKAQERFNPMQAFLRVVLPTNSQSLNNARGSQVVS